jgi:hypothetical protein
MGHKTHGGGQKAAPKMRAIMSGKTQTVKSDDFEIVDRPTAAVNTESEGKPQDIMEALLSGKAIEKKIETSRGKFTARYPMGRERLRIDQLKAVRRGGIPASSFDEYAEFNNNVYSTLDVVIVDGPDWYLKAKTKNPEGWSWEEVPDEHFIVELFNLVRSFRTDVANAVQQAGPGKTVTKGKPAADKPDMGGGAFSGLTNGSTDTKTDGSSNSPA